MTITKVANSEVKGFANLGEWTEPKFVGTEVQKIDEDAVQFEVDDNLQNRIGVELNDYGFLATSKKTDEIGKYLLAQAELGIASEDALPAITVGKLDSKVYLIGGHGRLSGLAHARKACGNGHLELFDDPNSGDEKPSDRIKNQLGSLRVNVFECSHRRDLETLAGKENSDAQNGERITAKELTAQIESALRDPFKAQFKDEALGQRFFDVAGMRAKIYNIRRRMFKANECPVQQGSINVHGKPQKPSRPGSTTLKKLDVVSTQLSEEYVHLEKLKPEERSDKTYSGFLRVIEKWGKLFEDAFPWLSDEERKQLPKDIETLKEKVGYTAFEASKQQEMDLSTPEPKADKDAEADPKAESPAVETADPKESTPKESTPEPKAESGNSDESATDDEAVDTSTDAEAVSETLDMAAKIKAEMDAKAKAEASETIDEGVDTLGQEAKDATGDDESTPREAFLKQLMKDARSLQARLIVGNFTSENIDAIIMDIAAVMKSEDMDV